MVKLNMIDSKKIIEMKNNQNFFEAEFIDRPIRFITKIKINNEIVLSHLPDPGRLKELLIPGVKLLVQKESGLNRKTRFSTQAVFKDGILISLNTLIPNKFVSFLLKNKSLPFLKDWEFDSQEVSNGHSRFDFRLTKNNLKKIVEVKSVSLVQNKVAKFPDAVTERGTKHVKHLAELISQDLETMVLFVIQRPDADHFEPQWERDPQFSKALLDASNKGVHIKVIKMKMTPQSLIYLGEVPYKLEL